VFAELLSIPLPERYPALSMTPQQLKQQTLDALVGWLLEEAERQPLLTVWEDLQLADPTTLEMLGKVIDQTPTVPLLNVLTFRPEFVSPWPARSHMTPITLNRLDRPEIEVMITNLAGGKAMPGEVLEHIVTKTDGVPLFIEELTKMLLESGLLREELAQYDLVGSLSDVAIPATLQDSLMARLDQLSAEREVVQLAAVLGREFAYEMLQALTAEKDEKLQQGLARLVETDMLYARGRARDAKYVFKHAMVRDVAYGSLLHSTRRQYHQEIARMLETRFSENLTTQPELVAHHYTEAGQHEKAIIYWQQAAERAIGRSANIEAVNHLNKGLEVLKLLPDTRERTLQELQLLTTLGPVLMATKGYAAPETERVYLRAKELCQKVGEAPQLFPVLAGLWRFYLLRAEYNNAQEFAEQLLSLAKLTQNRVFLLEASRAMGSTLFYLGELAEARSHLEQGMILYDPREHGDLGFQYGQDPGMACRSYASWVLWLLGYPDQAQETSREAVTLAEELKHPFSLTMALSFAAWLHQFRREMHLTYERAESAHVLSTEKGFRFWIGWEMVMKGWALDEKGSDKKKIAMIQQGLDTWQATGSELGRPYFLALLAEVHGKLGQAKEGLCLLAEALTLVDNTEERWCEAELHRLKGELLLCESLENQDEAESCFQKALDIANCQQAKSLELRAAMSLSRLWQVQGKNEDAPRLLSEIYGWFTEGFDTEELKEAKTLLEDRS
jgi:predicted ATPase